ncbi:PASTA domain-containing protein [Weissella paramesenteroides]|nr:PASTA domain-containing protein [Weissella paramesenteroides]KAA8437728.1 PASTA domain-containing protein [Weissella paramesenteroides]
MGKIQLIGKAVKIAAPFVIKAAPAVIEQVNKINEQQKEKKKDYIKIPDVLSLPINEATEVLTKYHFNYSLIKLPASGKIALQPADTVLKLTPKGGSNVSPNTFVKLYYADETIINESMQKRDATLAKKTATKEKHKAQIKTVADKAKFFSKH